METNILIISLNKMISFKIDLIVWKLEYINNYYYVDTEFKIDLIVWKRCFSVQRIVNLRWFKIDLIVWKRI